MKQYLYLSTIIACEAASDKKMLEALAFSLCIKLTFVSSRVQSAHIRRMKYLFGIGSDRASRLIKNGIKFGYLIKDGDDIVATPVKTSKSYHVRLEFDNQTYSVQTGEKRCRYKLNNIIDIIRKSVLLNHISKQSDCRDNVYSPTESCVKRRKSRKKINSMLCTGRFYDGLSNARIRNLVLVGRAKAKKLINNLVIDGLVNKQEVSIVTDMTPETFCRERANAFFKKSGQFGYLYKKWNSDMLAYQILCRVSNIYKYNCDLIRYIK